MELTQAIMIGSPRVVYRRVVATKNHLGPLQAQHTVRLWPAPVVANDHASHPAPGLPSAKAEVADLKIAFFQVLERRLRSVVGVPWQMNFSVLADDAATGVDQDRGVEAPLLARRDIELAIAEVKAQT